MRTGACVEGVRLPGSREQECPSATHPVGAPSGSAPNATPTILSNVRNAGIVETTTRSRRHLHRHHRRPRGRCGDVHNAFKIISHERTFVWAANCSDRARRTWTEGWRPIAPPRRLHRGQLPRRRETIMRRCSVTPTTQSRRASTKRRGAMMEDAVRGTAKMRVLSVVNRKRRN